MIERPNHVRVTNTNKTKIVGRFDGEDYEFLPNKPNDIPVAVAAHIFDFGREDKTRALNRLGWMQTSDQLEAAMEKLNAVRFTEAPPLVEADLVEEPNASSSELLPANEGGTAPPRVPGQGAAGGGGRQRKLPGPQTPEL
jgi:hypothetical protein